VPLLRALLTFLGAAIAVVVGLFTAAAIAVVAAVVFVAQRLLGRKRPPSRPTWSQSARPARSDDVIDVTATEVRTDPHLR